MKSFFSEKRGQKLGCVLYTGTHYTRVNTVHLGLKGNCRTQIMGFTVPHPSFIVFEASFKITGVRL